MPIEHVRDIASVGVITDMSPFDLPLGAWSWGSNVRFRNKTISRAPVLRSALTGLSQSSPRFLSSTRPASGYDAVIIGYLNGCVSYIQNAAETDYSVSGFTNNSSEAVYTSCILGDIFYINRNDRAPWALLSSATQFEILPNWAPVSGPWTCNILRACNSALCAFGVTQDGVYYPTMVLTSEFTVEETVPPTWDYTLGTNNATQNSLEQMNGPITDACPLGNVMMVYGENETWVMYLTGDDNIWGYTPLFSDAGAINANCAVEVDKKHFVFGLQDIWMHDGNSKVSIADEKVREFIFASLNVSLAYRCGVTYNPNLKEVCFRYPSGDQYCYFTNADGCNRQAVFHIPTQTWSFDDLPFVFGSTMANLNTTQTWNTVPGTWATIGGTWFSQQAAISRVMCMVGDVNSTFNLTESLYAFDLEGPGSIVSYPVDTNATQGWTLIRDGIDLHELGTNLRNYDLISTIYPQARMDPAAQPISFSFGSADYFNETVTMSAPQTYDGNTLYRLDYNAAGRYLFMEITHDDYRWVQFNSLDLDVDTTGDW